MPDAAPSVYAYLDHRLFLQDWFSWKKAKNPRFSHRMFARLAGQRSPSLLLLVSRGERNLTPRTAAAFCKAMDLGEEESAFFHLLVSLDEARTPVERNDIFARIAASRHFQAARPIEGDGFRYLSHWYIPAVRELATCPGFRADPAWIAGAMHPPITPAEAQLALDVLTGLGMIQVHLDGHAEVREVTVKTPHEVAGLAVHNYHQQMIQRAGDAITGVRSAERHLGAVTVAVPHARFAELKRELISFQERLLDLCDSLADPRDRVYQLNLQLFPLTAALAAPEPA